MPCSKITGQGRCVDKVAVQSSSKMPRGFSRAPSGSDDTVLPEPACSIPSLLVVTSARVVVVLSSSPVVSKLACCEGLECSRAAISVATSSRKDTAGAVSDTPTRRGSLRHSRSPDMAFSMGANGLGALSSSLLLGVRKLFRCSEMTARNSANES